MTNTPQTLDEARARAAALGLDLNDPEVAKRVEIFYRATTMNSDDYRFSYGVAVWASLVK